jgi:hypothetical protein
VVVAVLAIELVLVLVVVVGNSIDCSIVLAIPGYPIVHMGQQLHMDFLAVVSVVLLVAVLLVAVWLLVVGLVVELELGNLALGIEVGTCSSIDFELVQHYRR